MLRKLLSIICLIALFVPSVMAQSSSLTGTVTDAGTGNAVAGANVLLKEISRGAATDQDGNYSISNIQQGTYTLRVSFVGYKSKEQQVQIQEGQNEVNVTLTASSLSLDDIVVTAQGIQREQRALGYSVSTVETKELENKGQSDITRTLKGKIPGVDITQTSGVSGTATNFTIRGSSTISGSNQPLFIVDGVEFNTNTNTSSNFVDGGSLSQSSRFLDIDPNNIKSVNVLKGLSATTIYGAQGRNGVVIIETKSGSFNQDESGFNVSISQSLFANKIASLPDYQDKYGAGFHQNLGYFFSNWGPAFDRDISDNPLFIEKKDGVSYLKHPYSQFSDDGLRAAFPSYQKGGKNYKYPYKPFDTVGDFFRTGTVSNTNLNISGGTNGVNLNLNYGHSNNQGFTPNNNVIKNNVGLGLQSKVFERLTVNATANLALTDMQTPPIASSQGSSANTGGGGSVFGDVFYTPRNIDLTNFPTTNPVNGGSVYYRSGNDIQNPYWTANHSKSTDDVNRVYGKVQGKYKLIKGVNLTYKLGLDTYNEEQSYQLRKNGVTNPDLADGYYQTRNIKNTVYDHNLFINFKRQLTDDFSLDGVVGGQYVLTKYQQDGIGSQSQIIGGLFEHGNFTSPSATNYFNGNDFQYHSRRETAGAYFDATLGYQDYVYLDLSGRNDWFSTLETDNRSKFYPSASISFIPTDAFDIGGDVLDYLKIRFGVGTSAGPPSPYRTRSTLSSTPRGFIDASNNVITTNAISNRLGNRDLKPELQTEYEAGIESQFFNNRIGLNFSIYHRITSDLITDAQLDPATGFTTTATNIGEVENNGIEIKLRATPINQALQWNTTFNFFTYESVVNDLGQDLSSIAVAGFTNLGNFAIEGEPLNIMQGSRVARDDQGRRLVNNNGEYISSDEIGIIGNPNPQYTLSSINTFNYKNFSLTAQIDFQQGGDVYSTTIASLLARGETTDTGFDRQVPVILPGYKQNGEPNDIQISSTQAYFGDIGFGPDENYVYDATNVRLSELSLSYNLPAPIVGNTPLRGISVTLSGYNLWYFTPYIPEGTNFDPNVAGTGAGNGKGFDFLAGPSARRFGGTISVKF